MEERIIIFEKCYFVVQCEVIFVYDFNDKFENEIVNKDFMY